MQRRPSRGERKEGGEGYLLQPPRPLKTWWGTQSRTRIKKVEVRKGSFIKTRPRAKGTILAVEPCTRKDLHGGNRTKKKGNKLWRQRVIEKKKKALHQ